jgi:hypothetical protein
VDEDALRDLLRAKVPDTRTYEDGDLVVMLGNLMLENDLRWEAIADALGIGYKALYGLSGDPPLPLTFEKQARIAQVLQVPIDEIIRLSPQTDHPGRGYGPATRANDAAVRFRITLHQLLEEGRFGPDGIPSETAIVKRSRELFVQGEYTGDARVEPRRVSPKVAKRMLAEYRAFVEKVRLRQEKGQTLK